MMNEVRSGITTSEAVDQIFPALLRVQMRVGAVSKDTKGVVPGNRDYFYASLGATLDVCLGVLNEEGLVLMGGACAEQGALGVTTRLVEAKSGQYVETTFWCEAEGLGPRDRGTVLSYGRRYGIHALLELRTEDDDGKSAQDRHDERRTERALGGGERNDEKAERANALKRFWAVFDEVIRRSLAPGQEAAFNDKGLREAMASVFVGRVSKGKHTALTPLDARQLNALADIVGTRKDETIAFFASGEWTKVEGLEPYIDMMRGPDGE